jgi:hypothetical protein
METYATDLQKFLLKNEKRKSEVLRVAFKQDECEDKCSSLGLAMTWIHILIATLFYLTYTWTTTV